MSNITVTTTQNVIDVTNTSGITVTTPEGQTIAVTVPNSTVNVTNTTDDITILTAGTLNINSSGVVTSVNGDPGPAVVLTTTNINEGTNLYYTTARQNTDFDTRLATKTTTNLAEGSNLYYTNARADARVALGIAGIDFPVDSVNGQTNTVVLTTTDINEGTNLYYTTTRSNTDFDARLATKSTTNLAEGTNLYYTTARSNSDFDTRLATKSTTNLAEGTNLYYTDARSRLALSAGTGISYDNVTGVITNTVPDTNTTYTQNISSTTGGANLNLVGSDSTTDTVKFADGTGVTVSYTDANTATIAIGQDVATTANPTFAGSTSGNITVGVATDQTITTTSGDLILDSNSGTVSLNVPTITTDATTLALFNTTATTVNAFGAATTTNISTANGSILKGPNRSPFTSPIITAFTGTVAPSRGLLLNNGNGASAALARNTLLLRTYPTTGSSRGQLIFENARGTENVPTAVVAGDLMAEINATGYATNGFISDYVASIPALSFFTPTETWANTGGPYPTAGTVTNAGVGYQIALQPNATPLSAASRITVLNINPQTFTARSDTFTTQNKAGNTLLSIGSTGNVSLASSTPTVNGAQLNITAGSGLTASGGAFAQIGDVNITQFNSRWQSAFTPGFKYTGLASTAVGPTTGNGTAFEMSARWKNNAADTAFVPPQSGWGIGAFQFSADNSTNNTSQRVAGQIRCSATENWTSTATGTKMTFDANRQGTLSGVSVLDMSPETTTFRSDAYFFQDSAGTNIAGGKITYGRQYIEAYSTVDQSNPTANAENLMAFENTGISNGISIVTNGTALTRITFANAGIYNLQFSAQLSQTSGGNTNAFIWLKKNGANVADTAGDTRVAGNGDRIMAAWNYVFSAAAGDYYELAWSAGDTSVILDYIAASAPVPGVPSVILTVVPVGA